MKTHTKTARLGEVTLYREVVDFLANKYNKLFSTLILPKLLSIDTEDITITMPFYDGQTFNDL